MDEAEKYWVDFEAQTGEKVATRSMGIWHENGNEKGLWGIAILTDKAFRFKYIPSDNLILGLFRPPELRSAKREDVDIIVPLGEVSLIEEPRRSWLSRIFGSPMRRFEVAWGGRDGAEPRREVFSVDPSSDFLGELRRALAR